MIAAAGARVLARVAHTRGDADRAHNLLVEALAVTAAAEAFGEVFSVLEDLALVFAGEGDDVTAARLLGAARAGRDRLGCRPWPAEAARLAELRARLSHVPGAAAAEALTAGEQMSVAEVVALASRGRGSRKRAAFGWDSLTRAERDVAMLAGQGHSNDEIATRLFVSRNTVKTHLAHIYVKLEIRNRTQLAARVRSGSSEEHHPRG